MNTRLLPKAITMSVVALLAMILLSGSVPQVTSQTSLKPVSSLGIKAPILLRKNQPVKSANKKKVSPTTVPYLAQITAKPPTTLLPAVAQVDITPHHQKLSDAVLRALPAQCRTYLKNYFVKYKDVKQRGLGGKTTIILDGTPADPEFVGLLVHECAHVTHSNMMGTASTGDSAYRDGNDSFYTDSPVIEFFNINWKTENVLKAGSKKADFASGYAQSDAFEDFAEAFALYILHRPAMRERAKTNTAIAAKLAWMEKYLPVSETAIGTDTYTWNNVVPWDVTKLPFELSLTK